MKLFHGKLCYMYSLSVGVGVGMGWQGLFNKQAEIKQFVFTFFHAHSVQVPAHLA